MCVGSFHFNCCQCGRADSADPNTPRGRDELCFRCHIGGISFAFRGPTGGRESFHSETLASVTNETVAAARAQGREVRPKTKINGAFSVKPSAVAK
jgi:hypothetical protein